MSVGREVYDLLWKNKMFKFDRDELSDMRESYDIDVEFDADKKGMSFEDWAYRYCKDIRVSGAAGGTKYVNVQLLHMAPYLKDWDAAKALIEKNIAPVLLMNTGGYHDAVRIRFDRSILDA